MKKFTFSSLTLIFSLLFFAGNSQSILLTNYNSSTTSLSNTTPMDSHVTVENHAGSPLSIMVIRTVINKVAGMDELFCFGQSCYNPGTDSSTSPGVILAGKSLDFKAEVIPNGFCGTTNLHYRFYDINNVSDSVGVDLSFGFCTATGINDPKEVYGVSAPSRNPADGFTVFSYNLPSNDVNDRLVVYNMLGAFIKSVDIPASKGTLVMTTSELKSGVYIVSYLSGGRIKSTSRLVVSH
jgi:hypothetical protein